MAEGDWGVALPITVDEVTLTEHDLLKFIFKDQNNGNVILTKEYTPVENTVNLSLPYNTIYAGLTQNRMTMRNLRKQLFWPILTLALTAS